MHVFRSHNAMQMAAETVAKDVLVNETHLMYQSLVFWLDPVPF